MFKGMDLAPTFAGSKRDVLCSGSKGGFVNADKTKAIFYSGNDIDGARSISIFRSSDFSAGFLPTSALEVAHSVLAIAIW